MNEKALFEQALSALAGLMGCSLDADIAAAVRTGYAAIGEAQEVFLRRLGTAPVHDLPPCPESSGPSGCATGV